MTLAMRRSASCITGWLLDLP
uniref:Uncharacterized protein n=2 Tax=Anguilla anguilla TaxID=7936 RepID=A0A0E9XW10_ANGAN